MHLSYSDDDDNNDLGRVSISLHLHSPSKKAGTFSRQNSQVTQYVHMKLVRSD